MSATITIPDPLPKHQLIYSYFWESTGVLEIFQKVCSSYLLTDDLLKLDPSETKDGELINMLKALINIVFDRPKSTIAPTLHEMRMIEYWKLYGLTIKGKENFPKIGSHNKEFMRLFRGIMIEILQGQYDKDNSLIKYGNGQALLEMLNNLKNLLNNRTYNQIQDTANLSAFIFNLLKGLIERKEDNHLMSRLGVRSEDLPSRIKEIGEKVKIKASSATEYLILLAVRMDWFLAKVQDTVWDYKRSVELFDDVGFKELASAWREATGIDFAQEALALRGAGRNLVTRPMPSPPSPP